jgi:hypothetical protein
MSDKPQSDEVPQTIPETRPKPTTLPEPMESPEEVRTWDSERQDKPPEKPVKP